MARLLPIASSQLSSSIDHVQTLLHIAIFYSQGLHKDLFAAAIAECTASMQSLLQKDPAFRQRENGVQPQTLGHWISEEEVRRTAWYAAWVDRTTAERSRESRKVGAIEDIGIIPLPTDEQLWRLTQAGNVEVTLSLSTPYIPGRATIHSFFNPIAWQPEDALQAPLGYGSFSMGLYVYCYGKVNEYRRFCVANGIFTFPLAPRPSHLPFDSQMIRSTANPLTQARVLADQITLALTTWLARLHTAVGAKPPPVHYSLESALTTPPTAAAAVHPLIVLAPWAFALCLQYHLLWVFWMSPIPLDTSSHTAHEPNKGARPKIPSFVRALRDILLYESGPAGIAPPNIAAWICGPTFTMCIAHSELALDVFEVMVTVHLLEEVYDYVPGGWDLNPAMAILPFYITIKELLRGKTASSAVSGREGGSLTVDTTSNFEPVVYDSNLQALINRTGTYVNGILRVALKHDREWFIGAARVRLVQRFFTAMLNSSTVDELNQRWGLILNDAGARWRMLSSEAEEPTLDLPFAKGDEEADGLMHKCLW
ncbi:hypothetical protein M427DRAFT_57335 [Gonapodya prolifera JEL478]|uniref:Transcription factor domain-containing protein n=1 Tax=Gonapodya prolifera (strain JEL478) TaxID=1344416 RepID=A0A139AD39_GONPJ|nr:hypothetical protein M427DRAFT_57335 [Gonapodya prolifera JEL478]|eukprot:KXS14668.1 hypothetical protein M427DRAFT_57335 [Gonapodya prolifera JEL478]